MIDCDFENLMNEKDIVSMTRQISDCYSTNRKANIPFNLVLFDLNQQLETNLVKNNYQNWIGLSGVKKGTYNNIKEYNKDKEIIYLTADSDNEISELSSNHIYIIGGIVDRNKHKLLTFNKANEMGIKHARLPIGDYLHLKSSKVLATNHVFSILSHYVNIKNDWKEAFLSIIPKRKFYDK
jgi:tRNA (guanine9-N1)-methyltransferase